MVTFGLLRGNLKNFLNVNNTRIKSGLPKDQQIRDSGIVKVS